MSSKIYNISVILSTVQLSFFFITQIKFEKLYQVKQLIDDLLVCSADNGLIFAISSSDDVFGELYFCYKLLIKKYLFL